MKPLRSRVIIGLCLSFAALCGSAQAKAPSKVSLGAAPAHYSVLRATLPNGLHVVVVPNHFAPVVRTQIIYRVGSAMAPEAYPGTAHALEHMMFNGAQQVDRSQLSAISALIGNRNNAFTTEDTTQYYFEAPAQNLDLLLHVEADRMKGLLLNNADWQRERGAIEQEVSRDLSMPIERFLIQQNEILFGGTPYAHDALGTRESFDKTDTTRLLAFYEDWYQPNNATILIVGDVQPAEALACVKKQFGEIAAHHLPPRPQIDVKPAAARTIHIKSDYASGIFVLSFPAPGAQDKAGVATQLLTDALNNERGALAGLRARGEALYAAASYAPRMEAGVLLVFAAYPKGTDPEPLMHKIQAILKDVRHNGVPASFVTATKRRALTELAADRNSVSGLASAWSDALTIDPESSPEARAAEIARVSDTDLRALAGRILDPAHALTGVITPSKDADSSGANARAPEHFLPPAEKDTPLPDWASRNLAQVEIPSAFPKPRVFKLKNGLTLLVKLEPSSKTVQLYGMIKHDARMQEPVGKEGVLDLTDRLFLFGSHRHGRVALAEALDALGANADTGLEFSVTALVNKFDAAFRLMAEVERDPAFPDDGLNAFKQQTVAALPGYLNSPGYQFSRALLKKINPPGDPALRDETLGSVKGLTSHDVAKAYKNIYRPDETVIVMVGNISAEHARSLVEEAFGDWQNPDKRHDINLPPRPANTPSVVYVGDPGRTQSDVTLIQTLKDGIQNQERYALGFGANILGNGFKSRLLQSLRVKTGLVYTVQSAVSWSRQRGAFSINFGSDPDNVTRARDLALQDVAALCTVPISEKELHTTKAAMLRAMPMQRASFDALAATYLRLNELGLPLDEEDKAAHAIYAMTSQQVQDAFCHQISVKRMVQAIFGPKQQTDGRSDTRQSQRGGKN